MAFGASANIWFSRSCSSFTNLKILSSVLCPLCHHFFFFLTLRHLAWTIDLQCWKVDVVTNVTIHRQLFSANQTSCGRIGIVAFTQSEVFILHSHHHGTSTRDWDRLRCERIQFIVRRMLGIYFPYKIKRWNFPFLRLLLSKNWWLLRTSTRRSKWKALLKASLILTHGLDHVLAWKALTKSVSGILLVQVCQNMPFDHISRYKISIFQVLIILPSSLSDRNYTRSQLFL